MGFGAERYRTLGTSSFYPWSALVLPNAEHRCLRREPVAGAALLQSACWQGSPGPGEQRKPYLRANRHS